MTNPGNRRWNSNNLNCFTYTNSEATAESNLALGVTQYLGKIQRCSGNDYVKLGRESLKKTQKGNNPS
jgi:hypothetical protein